MTASTTDGETPTDRVQRLLNEAQDAIAETDDPDPAALRDLADEANDLVASTETAALIVAAGVDIEDDAPESIPAAIARGDARTVADLRLLLALSRLSEQEGEATPAIEDDIRELAEKGSRGAAGDEEPTADGKAAEESTAAEESESEEEESDDGLERLESELQSRFGDGIDEFREEIESARAAVTDRVGDDEAASGDEEGEGEEAKTDTETADRSPSSGHRRGTLSTIPSSNRPDMNVPGRLSTLRSAEGE